MSKAAVLNTLNINCYIKALNYFAFRDLGKQKPFGENIKFVGNFITVELSSVVETESRQT